MIKGHSSTYLRALFILVLGFAVLLIGMKIVVSRLITTQFLEEFLEDNLSASAHVESVQVSFLKQSVVLNGLRLWPLEKRSEKPDIEVGRVELGVNILPLFSRDLETHRFVISDPNIRLRIDSEGENSLDELFRRPGDEDGHNEEPSQVSQQQSRVLEAEKNRWLAKLKETRLDNGSVNIFLEKEKVRITVEDFAISVNDLQFDPEELTTINAIDMALAGKVNVYDSVNTRLLHLGLDGLAHGQLFDEVSGELALDVSLDLALSEPSFINPQVKIVRRIWTLLEEIEKVGINLGSLPNRILFGRSRRISGRYAEGVVTLVKPLSLSVGEWEVGLAKDSWIETHSTIHQIGVEFLAGKKVSQLLGGWLDSLPREVENLAQQRFFDEKQVLWRVNSKGEFRDPELDFISQLPEAKTLFHGLEDEVDRIRKEANRFLKGFLGDD